MDALVTGALLAVAIILFLGCCGPHLLTGLRSWRRGTNMQNFGYGEANMRGNTIRLNISGMTCDGCADTISRYLKKEKGVLEVAIQWRSGTGEVTFDPEATSEEKILASRAFQGHYSAEVER